MSAASITSFLLLALSSVSCLENSRPNYIQCQSNLECDLGYCCTIGPIRYSIPQCKPLQDVGQVCRPGSVTPINMTVSYPDGAQVLLTDVHYILCPCADGLTCNAKEGMCKESDAKHDTNRLIDGNSKRDDY